MGKIYKTLDEYCDAIQELTTDAINHLWDLEQLAKTLPDVKNPEDKSYTFEELFVSRRYKLGTIDTARTELHNIFDSLREIEDDCTGLTESIHELTNAKQ